MHSSVNARIDRIKAKVRQHGIRLGPCLPETDVKAFENRHQIALPSGYREFLLHVGNGGEGPPAYGCAALGKPAVELPDTPFREKQILKWTELADVSKPFPFTVPWIWDGDDDSTEGTEGQRWHGCIYIGNNGCGMFWFLIVTGAEAGIVWMICGEGMQPTQPKRDFLQWYEDWLEGVRNWWQ